MSVSFIRMSMRPSSGLLVSSSHNKGARWKADLRLWFERGDHFGRGQEYLSHHYRMAERLQSAVDRLFLSG